MPPRSPQARHPGIAFAVWAGLAAGTAGAQPAQAPQSCTEDLRRLEERLQGMRGDGLTPAATRDEIDDLAGYHDVARRIAEAGEPGICAAVVRHAMAVARSIERPAVVLTDRLENTRLRNADGLDVGVITEMVVDPRGGRIAYGIVELGGFLGIGERYFPVPWALFEATPDADALVLHVDRDRLRGAPQFTSDNRPDMADRRWALAVHTYYGVDPYWLAGGRALAAIGRAGGASGSTTGSTTGSGRAADAAGGGAEPAHSPDQK